jgi:hypothetical protein
MDRKEMIETLKLFASGQAFPGTIVKQWLWINRKEFKECATIPGYNIPHDQFRQFVNNFGGTHYVFEPGIEPKVPTKSPFWLSLDYKTYSKDDPTRKDEPKSLF